MESEQASDAVIRNLPEPATDSSLRQTWRAWGNDLRRRHLNGVAVALLDASGPLVLVYSQLLHFAGPLLGRAATYLALLLESERETAAFRDFLSATRRATDTASGGEA